MLNMHPDSVMYYIGYPMGPDRTLVVSEYLFEPETITSPDFGRITSAGGKRTVQSGLRLSY